MTQTAKDLTKRQAELEAALRANYAEAELPEGVAELRDEGVALKRAGKLKELAANEQARRELTFERDEKRRAIKNELHAVRNALAAREQAGLRAEFVRKSDEEVVAVQKSIRSEIAVLNLRAEAAQAELDMRAAEKKIGALSPAEREALRNLDEKNKQADKKS